jgi:hypothetical protein
MKQVRIFGILLLSLSIYINTGCSPDDDKDGVGNNSDKCENTPIGSKVDQNGCPIVRNVKNLHFYIETSASMGGYFQKDADFKTIISDLTSKLEQTQRKPLDIRFIAENEIKYEGDAGSLSREIAITQIAKQKSSELHKILSKIAKVNAIDDVSIFVSDCILSFPDSDIAENREINKQEAPNALKNNIYTTFSELKNKGLATSVYAFNSKFYGTYYNYKNDKINIKGSRRPFYIWVIADKEILRKFNSTLTDITTFRPEKSLHFGLNDKPVSEFNIISQIEKNFGEGLVEKNGIAEIGTKTKITKAEPLSICVGLNLSVLPDYTTKINYLQSNLLVNGNGCNISFQVRDKNRVDISKLTSEPQKKMFESATHILIFKVESMPLSQAKIDIYLPLKYDSWYQNWSCNDDLNLAVSEGKTFAFEYLIQGVTEAYSNKMNDYINFSINLTK